MNGTILYCGQSLPFAPGETVLDCLLRHDQPVASSCRSGVCQSCIVQGQGAVPPQAQRGLKPSLVAQGYFLACQCAAEDGLEVLSADNLPIHAARVASTAFLAPGILQVQIERPPGLDFRAGQFLQLIRPSDGLTRSYSVASLPSESIIELHVALLPGGRMGHYLSETAGAPLSLRGPTGDCFYLEDKQEEPLLLLGTGTGLAPLVGILRAAMAAEHRGPIHLFHGSRESEGLYMSEELHRLSEGHERFNYTESVLFNTSNPVAEATAAPTKDLFDQVKETFPSLHGYRVYLCGNPEFVRKMKKQCFLAGAAMQSIHSDPFVLATQ